VIGTDSSLVYRHGALRAVNSDLLVPAVPLFV